jgi:signal transduction histidine kinase
MFFFTYTAFVLAAACFVFASFILSRKPKDLMARYFVLYVYSVALWIVSNSFADIAKTPPSLIFWSGTALIGASFWITYYLCFIDVFMFKARPKLWRRALYYFPSVIFTLGAFSKYSVVETFFPEGVPTQIIPGIFYTYLMYFNYAALAYSTVLLVWFFFKRAQGSERRQAFFMWFGFLILVAALVYFIIILPLYFNELRFFNVGPQFALFMILLSSYTILRHRLFDIQLIVKKGAVFTILFAFILLFFNSLISLSSVLFPGKVSYVITALVITVIFSPLKNWLEKMTDKIFFRRHHSFGEMIGALNKSLEHVQSPADFTKNIGVFLQNVLKIHDTGFLIADEQGLLHAQTPRGLGLKRVRLPSPSAVLEHFQFLIAHQQDPMQVLERADIDYRTRYEAMPVEEKTRLLAIRKELRDLGFEMLVPFVNNDKVIGLLFLGPKLSGDQLYEPDFHILEALAREGSITLHNAITAERTTRLNDLKSEFVRVVSHQLRTPLSAAKWNTDLLLGQKLSRGLSGPMADIQINLSKISDGLTSMLTVMEIAEDKIELKKTDVDFTDLVASTIKNFSVLASKRKVRVRLHSDVKRVTPSLDVDKIRKIISVLLTNALMYSPQKTEIRIEVTDQKGEIVFAIEDHGLGVAKKDREEIFQKFFRGEEAKRMAPDGLGVSLYIARDFITRHGGKLWVEGREDKKPGARFVFTVPLMTAPATVPQTQTLPVSLEQTRAKSVVATSKRRR